MSAVVEIENLEHQLAPIRAALREAFDVDFVFLVRLGEDWIPANPSGDNAEGWHADVLQLLGSDRRPRVFTGDGGSMRMALPLRIRMARVTAMAVLPPADPDQLIRFAKLTLREFDQRREIERLGNENQAFLCQVTHDFEELVFLRSMADLLEMSDFSFDLGAMAGSVLPKLRPLCEADTMVVVAARQADEHEQTVLVEGPRLWCGERSIDDDTCVRLVEQFHELSMVQPVVKNRFDKIPDGEAYAGIQSFILVPIVNAKKVIGWMLALNRNNDGNLWVEDEGWEVSYLEFGTHEATLMGSTASILATHARNVELFREREALLVSVVRALVSAIEAKDEYTRGHSERVALYGKRLAEELGQSEDYCERLYMTGLLHDVGKIGVRDAVLRKPGPLTEEEFDEIKQHPDQGWDILRDLEPLRYVLPGVLHHHEQINGNGYPDNLVADDIPQDGRILAVADAYDAMTSDRPYRPGMPQQKAEAILRSGAGTQWDADMIDAFFRALPDILRIKETYQPRISEKRCKSAQ